VADLVLCPHCGMWVDPAWGACAHDPATPDWLVRARILGRPIAAAPEDLE
jgi:hypothetical protein